MANPYQLVSLTDLKTYLGISDATYDTILQDCINRASTMIETYLGRNIVSRTYTEWRDSTGQRSLVVRNFPIQSVFYIGIGERPALVVNGTVSTDVLLTVGVTDSAVILKRMTSGGTETSTTLSFTINPTTTAMASAISAITGFSASVVYGAPSRFLHRSQARNLRETTGYFTVPANTVNDYRIQNESGVLHTAQDVWGSSAGMFGRLPNGSQSILIEYTGGYSVVPYDIAQACLVASSAMYKNRLKDPTMQSEHLGEYSYGKAPSDDAFSQVTKLIDGYRRIL